MTPQKLELYSFWWSEARLVLAAIALILGGTPLIKVVLPFSIPLLYTGLTLSWLISGAVSLYLVYRWLGHGQHLFGGKKPIDMIAFAIMIISGINLGIAGLIGTNIGMSTTMSYAVFLITALAYLWTAYHLYMRFHAHGGKFF
jgi:uncharacterized membrane protein YuzA (DUF378 family)